MTFYLDELFDIFLSPFYPVYTMCGHFLPLILLAALAVFFWPALGCENWPGKINLSCLFSFFLFNNGNYHQDYLAQRFLLVLVLVVLALTDKFISETCKIENVCRQNILCCIAAVLITYLYSCITESRETYFSCSWFRSRAFVVYQNRNKSESF